jgi:hypothetical protein
MKVAFLLIVFLLVFGCESKQAQTIPPSKDSKSVSNPKAGASFSGGDGSSIEEAVIITAPNNYLGIRAEYDWIKKNCPGWQLELQSVLKGGGKVYDKMYFRTPNGRRTNLFFDVTDFYGKK